MRLDLFRWGSRYVIYTKGVDKPSHATMSSNKNVLYGILSKIGCEIMESEYRLHSIFIFRVTEPKFSTTHYSCCSEESFSMPLQVINVIWCRLFILPPHKNNGVCILLRGTSNAKYPYLSYVHTNTRTCAHVLTHRLHAHARSPGVWS